MNDSIDLSRLNQAAALCIQHREALNDALTDLASRQLNASDLGCLSKPDRRLLDQFAYRFTRLQDDMGTRLFPAVLRALGEEVSEVPALDRFARLEQIGWLPNADRWSELRRIRNEFAHDYPESLEERFARLSLAAEAADEALGILDHILARIRKRFPNR